MSDILELGEPLIDYNIINNLYAAANWNFKQRSQQIP
jgi:hypothetical protein